jgi:CheY-like chemotaxis protein
MPFMESTLKHVLMVEDNPAHARLIRAHLEDFIGLTIDWVRDGDEVMGYLEGAGPGRDHPQPNLILLDMKLKRVDGPEVLRQLKADDRFRHIPVVVLTTSRDAADMASAYEHSANSYLVKSTDFEEMQAMLHHAVAFWCEWNQLPKGRP